MRQPFALQDARIVWENTTFHLDPYDYTYVGDCAHVDPWSLDPTHQAVRVIHRHLPVPVLGPGHYDDFGRLVAYGFSEAKALRK